MPPRVRSATSPDPNSASIRQPSYLISYDHSGELKAECLRVSSSIGRSFETSWPGANCGAIVTDVSSEPGPLCAQKATPLLLRLGSCRRYGSEDIVRDVSFPRDTGVPLPALPCIVCIVACSRFAGEEIDAPAASDSRGSDRVETLDGRAHLRLAGLQRAAHQMSGPRLVLAVQRNLVHTPALQRHAGRGIYALNLPKLHRRALRRAPR